MNRVVIRVTQAFVLILAVSVANKCIAATEDLAFCQAKFAESQSTASGLGELIETWSAQEDRCQGTGFFEYQMSKLHIAYAEYDKAFAWIERGLQHDTAYNRELSLAKGDIALHQGNYGQAEAHYIEVTAEYPQWFAGFDYLGFSVFAQGRYQQAVDHLNKANSLQESADAYRTLTLAHYMLGNHEQVIDSLNRAYSLNEAILSDRDPMIAGVRSYAEVGRFDLSRDMLALLLREDPNIKSDQEFLHAGYFLRQKMVDAGLAVSESASTASADF